MSDTDESESIGVGSEFSSQCGNDMSHAHDGAGRYTKLQGRKRQAGSIPTFRCTYTVKEDHNACLYGCAFNPYYKNDDGEIFATVGGARATIYRCIDDEKFKPIYSFMDPDDDMFYACAWLYNVEAQSHVLAVGGKRGVIHLIPFCGTASITHLSGHGQAINELTTHPTDPRILLSAGKDNELRMWNVRSGVCVAIFGGDGGHRSEVLTCDFDLLGERIVSSGMDHCIKIWSILDNHRVDKAVQQSKIFVPELNVENFPTVKVTQPDFSTLDVHKNYVDCIRWYGETLLSKSCENAVCHWKPGSQRHLEFSKGETNVSLIRRFRLPACELWFIKFAFDNQFRWLAAGNQVGKIYVWDANALSGSPKCLQHSRCSTVVRQVAFSPDGTTLLAVCDDSTVWRWKQRGQ